MRVKLKELKAKIGASLSPITFHLSTDGNFLVLCSLISQNVSMLLPLYLAELKAAFVGAKSDIHGVMSRINLWA